MPIWRVPIWRVPIWHVPTIRLYYFENASQLSWRQYFRSLLKKNYTQETNSIALQSNPKSYACSKRLFAYPTGRVVPNFSDGRMLPRCGTCHVFIFRGYEPLTNVTEHAEIDLDLINIMANLGETCGASCELEVCSGTPGCKYDGSVMKFPSGTTCQWNGTSARQWLLVQ